MNRLAKLLALAGVAFLLFGCDMLTTNIFSIFDRPRIPSIEDIAAMEDTELIDTVEELVESDSFYQDIEQEIADTGTSETRTAIVDNLNEVIADPDADTADKQDAAVLVAEIELNTTAAGQVVDNFVGVAAGLIDGTIDTTNTDTFAQDIIEDVFAGTDITDETSFDEALAGLLAAADAYTYYGESLDDTGEVVAPEGDNIGAIAQDAVVALLLDDVLANSTLTGDDLKAYVLDGTPLPTITITGDPLVDNTAISNILDASGLGDLIDQGATV